MSHLCNNNAEFHFECHYAECHYAECRGTLGPRKVVYEKKLQRKEAEPMKVSPLKLMEPYHSQNMQSVSERKVHFSSERKKS